MPPFHCHFSTPDLCCVILVHNLQTFCSIIFYLKNTVNIPTGIPIPCHKFKKWCKRKSQIYLSNSVTWQIIWKYTPVSARNYMCHLGKCWIHHSQLWFRAYFSKQLLYYSKYLYHYLSKTLMNKYFHTYIQPGSHVTSKSLYTTGETKVLRQTEKKNEHKKQASKWVLQAEENKEISNQLWYWTLFSLVWV